MNKLATTAAIALTNMFIGHAAFADGSDGSGFPACSDDRGETVTYHSEDDPTIDYKGMVMYAGARYLDLDTISTPVIIYDESFLDGAPQVMLDFTMAHECFHLSSGDARYAYEADLTGVSMSGDEKFRLENRANCSAAHDLRDIWGYKPEDVSVLESEMRARMSNRHANKFMPIIQSCFKNETPRPY